MRRLRVLVVSPSFPFPPAWGFGIRVFQLTRFLAARHEVTLLTYARPDELVHVDSLRQVIGDVRVVIRQPNDGLKKRAAQLASIPSKASYQVLDLQTAEMQAAINQLLSDQDFDVVQLESSQLTGFRYETTGAIVLDEHNIEYELLKRVQRAERSWFRRLYNRAEYRKFLPIEQASWRGANGCVVTSDREAAIVRAHAPTTPVAVVPNGVDPDFFRPSGLAIEPNTLVFNGLLAYRPNFDAASYLVTEILPAVHRLVGGVTLTIVGAGDRSELESLRGPGVVVTGLVPDVRPYLDRAAVVVVPIRMGGGTRLKVVEALALAKGVVSTTIGCEGIGVRDGEHLLRADDPDAFAARIVNLLADPARASSLGQAGRQLMIDQYSWERCGERLEDLYRQVVPDSCSDVGTGQ